MPTDLLSEFVPLPPQRECTKCGESKPADQYGKHKLGRDGLQPRCKSCRAVDAAEYRARTVVERAVYNKQYREDNRESHLAYNRAWNRRNRGRVNEAIREYRRRNAATLRIAKALRRKLSAGRQDCLGAVERVRLYGGKCYYCGSVADTIDHRIPICRGGTNLPANLVPACRSCNSRKRHRTESEWKGWSRPRVTDA